MSEVEKAIETISIMQASHNHIRHSDSEWEAMELSKEVLREKLEREKEPQTNGDRIRGKSDEELAKELLFFRPSDAVFIGATYEENSHYIGLDGSYYQTAKQAINANMSWLQQEVSE